MGDETYESIIQELQESLNQAMYENVKAEDYLNTDSGAGTEADRSKPRCKRKIQYHAVSFYIGFTVSVSKESNYVKISLLHFHGSYV
jgi:hypothetical protein